MTALSTAAPARDGSETTGPAGRAAHFRGFELLRAVAATMVVVHHAGSFAGPTRTGALEELTAVADGGVAVFFVLSGFLIYRPFVAAAVAGRRAQRTASFWWRRVLRIVPAYWVVLTFFWALGSFDLGSSWWRYYLFLQIYSRETVLGGVVQAWSLCTEMTFYLLVPAWAWLVGRTGRHRGASRQVGVQLIGCGVLWAVGFASRWAVEAWVPSQRQLSFNWLPANLDLFATGMALAVVSVWVAGDDGWRGRLDRIATPVLPWWALAGALYAWYAYAVGPADFAVGYEGWFWHRRQLVLGVFTLLVMVPAVFGDQRRGALRRMWGWRPLVWVGTVSYGLYLWHFDWMKRSIASAGTFGQPGWPGWVHTSPGDSNFWYLVAVGMGAGLLFAATSWNLLEQPLARFKGMIDGALGPRRVPG